MSFNLRFYFYQYIVSVFVGGGNMTFLK